MSVRGGRIQAAAHWTALPRPAADAMAIVLGSIVLAVSAKTELPFWPVPMTLETLAVLALAGGLGARLAAAAVLLWLGAGFCGLAVFAGPVAGPGYFMGPTAGYLLGFLAAALLVGWAADRGLRSRPLLLFPVMLGGVAVIYVCGAAYLAHLIGGARAIELGLLPFVPADVTKAALAAALVGGSARLGARNP